MNSVTQDAIVVDRNANVCEATFGDARGSERVEALVGMLDDQQGSAIFDLNQVAAEAQRARSETRKTDDPMSRLGL